MIKVTIELYPRGNQEQSRVLGVMQIAQIEYHGDGIADYKIVADENPNPLTHQPFDTVTTSVKRHDRDNSVYSLLAKAARVAADGLTRKAAKRAARRFKLEKE